MRSFVCGGDIRIFVWGRVKFKMSIRYPTGDGK